MLYFGNLGEHGKYIIVRGLPPPPLHYYFQAAGGDPEEALTESSGGGVGCDPVEKGAVYAPQFI